MIVARFAGAEPHYRRLLGYKPGVPRIVRPETKVSAHNTPVAGARIRAGTNVVEEVRGPEPLAAGTAPAQIADRPRTSSKRSLGAQEQRVCRKQRRPARHTPSRANEDPFSGPEAGREDGWAVGDVDEDAHRTAGDRRLVGELSGWTVEEELPVESIPIPDDDTRSPR